jgi:hypothetical protein
MKFVQLTIELNFILHFSCNNGFLRKLLPEKLKFYDRVLKTIMCVVRLLVRKATDEIGITISFIPSEEINKRSCSYLQRIKE